MSQPAERARGPAQPRPAEPARKDPLPVGPRSSDPARHLIAALRAASARGLARSALDAAVRELEARLLDPAGARGGAGRGEGERDGERDGGDGAERDGAEREVEDAGGQGGEADLAPEPARRIEPALASPLRAPDALVLSGRWSQEVAAAGELARRRAEARPPDAPPPDEAEVERPPPPDRRGALPRGDVQPDPFAPHRGPRPAIGDGPGERRAPPRIPERARVEREQERARVREANAALDRYPVPPKPEGKAIAPPRPEAARAPAGPPVAPPAGGPGEKGAGPEAPGKPGKPGKPGAKAEKPAAPGVTATGGLEDTGAAASAAVDRWKGKVAAETETVKAPEIKDADKYVLTFKQAEQKKTGDTKTKTKKLIAEARAAVKPRKELEKAPLIPDPDPLPEARKLVDDLFPKPIPPDTLPKLERTPFGTIAELGTLVYRVLDKETGKPTGEEHILRELGKDALGREQYAEIHVVGHGQPAPRSMPGMKSEVRRPEQAPAEKGTLEERVTAINAAQRELVLKGNPKAGGPVTLESDLPPAAAEVPASFKVDVGAILAKILAAPGRYAKQITDAAARSFPGGKDVLPVGYADAFIGDVVGDLRADLGKVREAAGVKAEDLEKALELEKTKLDAKAKEDETKAIEAHKKARATEKRETKIVSDHIRGVREDIDHWLDDIAAATKGGYEAKKVRAERDRLIAVSKGKVERWIAHWEAMKKQRRKNLGEAASKRMMAYDAAAEMDRRRLAIEAKIDVPKLKAKKPEERTPEEKEYAAALDKLDRWLKGTGPESLRVREAKLIEDLQSTYDGQAGDAIQALKDAHTKAKRMIEQWATDRLSKEIGTLRRIINAILDWLGIARKDVDDWETVSVEDNHAVNAENNLFLEEMKLEHGKELTEDKIKAMKGLTDEQQAILKAYFVDPSTKGDAVAALAAGLVARLKAQREPVVHRKLEMKVLKDEPKLVIAVANARGRIDVSEKCSRLEAAMLGMGTNKQAIYDHLAGLDPIEARAVELFYETVRPGRSLRLELSAELYDLGEVLWGSKHDYQRAIALLDARPSAKVEAITVQLDQAMKGGFYGIGTDKKKIFELMRNRTPEEIAAIKRWYRKKYGRELEETVRGELDDGISPAYDKMRFDALMKRDTKLADALGMRSALGAKKEGGDPFTWAGSRVANWITRDQDAAVGTFDAIKEDIRADARRWGWTIEEQKAEYKRRVGAMEGEFDFLFASEYTKPGDKRSAMTAAFGQSFGFDEARLLEGKRTDNLALISAATISIEHKAILLPSRKKIDDTLAAQYRTAFDEAMWDLELEFGKRRQQELDAARTPEERDAVLKRWTDPQFLFDERKKLEKQAHELAVKKGGENMRALKAAYEQEFTYGTWTHGTFERDVMAATAPTAFFTNLQGPGGRTAETDKTAALLTQGGYLTGDQLLYFAVKGAGTTDEDVKYAHAGKSEAEIEAMYLKLAERLNKTTYKDATDAEKAAAIKAAKAWVLDDFSGRELVDTRTDMLGVAVTPEQKVRKAQKRKEYTLESMEGGIGDSIIGGLLLGPLGAVAGPSVGGAFRRWMSKEELALIDREIGRLEGERDKVTALKAAIEAMPFGKEREAKYRELEKQYERVALIEQAVDAAFVLQRKRVDSIVDTVTTIIQIVITAAAIIAAPFTGGATAAAATVMWMAVAASVATSVLSIAAKALLKGGDYGWEEFAVDAVMAVIEAVAAAATANLGDKFLKASFIKNLVEGGVIQRLIGHGLANGLEGVIQAIPGALFGAIANDATWQEGNPFLAILGAVATQAAISGAMSGAFGALRAFKKGAPHMQSGELEPPTVKELTAARASRADLDKLYEAYKGRRPGATRAELRAELDETILRLDRRAFAGDAVQRALRGELIEGLPAAQRKALGAARIEIEDGAGFRQRFGDAAEGAVVRWRDGQPIVIVRAGTDLGALGRTAPRLFDPPSAPVRPGAAAPAERHGVPRGASARPDPKAPPPPEPGQRVILEPFAGPNLESAMDLARKHPGANVVATEAAIQPPPHEIARLQAAGGAFHPSNMPAAIPTGSVDEIKMRFPLPHDDQMRSRFMGHLRDLQQQHPGRSLAELAEEATRRLETATAYGPYALQRLKPSGTLEVVFWEKRILGELGDLQKLRFVDPESGKIYKLELVGHEVLPKSRIAPHSGFGVPIGPHDPVDVARLRKVEVPFAAGPSGARGPLRPGEVVGAHSGRPFFPERAGGPIRELDFKKIKITDKGIEAVERHLARFGGGDAEAAMVARLRRIARGELAATDFDRAFYSHELRESVRYRKAGWPAGQPSDRGAAYDLWNDLHTATLEDYALRERDKLGRAALFHPDVDPDAPARGPTGARGPAGEPRPIHAWDPDQPLGFRPGERHLPPEVRAAVEAELARSKVVGRAVKETGGSLAVLDDDELIELYNSYRRRLKVDRPEAIPRAVAEGIEAAGEGGRCPSWVWVAALRNAGWTGAVADFPGRVAGLIHALKHPLTGTPLLVHRGSPAALAAHASTLPPGTQVYISARTKNGVLHALLGVVQPDGSLAVMHGPSGKTRVAQPLEGAEVGRWTRRGPAGEAAIGTRVYDVKAGDLAAYTEHKWWVLEVPPAPAKQPRIAEHVPTTGKLLAEGQALAPKARRNLEIDLEAAGHSRATLRLYDDNQILAAHGALQVELAPKRVAAFRGALDASARAELDALIDAPHLSSAPVAGPMEARLGKALGTRVEVDPRLPFGEVRVVPDVGAFGVLRGVKVVAGPGATVASVIAHIPTLHQYQRLVGVLGSARRAVDAVRRVLRGGGALPLDSRAHEAWRELQKLPPMIDARVRRLAAGELGVVDRVRLELEIEGLERQLARHAQSLGDLRPGRGYVAAVIPPFTHAGPVPLPTRSRFTDTFVPGLYTGIDPSPGAPLPPELKAAVHRGADVTIKAASGPPERTGTFTNTWDPAGRHLSLDYHQIHQKFGMVTTTPYLTPAGTPASIYAMLRVMRSLNIPLGGVAKMTLHQIQNIETVMIVNRAAHMGLTGPALLAELAETPLMRYARTIARQSGHDIVGIRLIPRGADQSTLGELMGFWARSRGPLNVASLAHAAHHKLLGKYKMSRALSISHDFDIELDLAPMPPGSLI